MVKKYKMFRFPVDALTNWINKKSKIEERIKIKTGKNVKVPMTEIIRYYGQQQRFEWDDNVIPYFMKSKKKKGKIGGQMI